MIPQCEHLTDGCPFTMSRGAPQFSHWRYLSSNIASLILEFLGTFSRARMDVARHLISNINGHSIKNVRSIPSRNMIFKLTLLHENPTDYVWTIIIQPIITNPIEMKNIVHHAVEFSLSAISQVSEQ